MTENFEDITPKSYGQGFPSHIIQPASVRFKGNVQLLSHSPSALSLLGLEAGAVEHTSFQSILTGAEQWGTVQPTAQAYAGHQFGHWVDPLGDGRAASLGIVEQASERWEVQLKGSGTTQFSRGGDGRAVLRSTLREYLCSEAMHALGIPTTRALAVFVSDEQVRREQLEPAALLVRIAPNYIRFGTCEMLYHRGEHDALKQLLKWVIKHHYPEVESHNKPVLGLAHAVAKRTAKMVAKWQAVGFCHGVMNTDNFSILGLTLDYGPFGFLNDYDAQHICNQSDVTGRYAFNQQPKIARWNMMAWLSCLLPWISEEEAREVLQQFVEVLDEHYHDLLHQKLGISIEQGIETESLINSLFELLQTYAIDYTGFFRALCELSESSTVACAEWQALLCLAANEQGQHAISEWLQVYQSVIQIQQTSSDAERQASMKRINPRFVLRNHLAQHAIERAEQGDYAETERLLSALMNPYADVPEGMDDYAMPPNDAQKRILVSCSA